MRILHRLVLAAALGLPGASPACMNGSDGDWQSAAVADAEKLLDDGNYARAVSMLLNVPVIKNGSAGDPPKFRFDDPDLDARALRVAAAAVVRSSGTISRGAFLRLSVNGHERSGERGDQIAWAKEIFAGEYKVKLDDPSVSGLYAEALAAEGKPGEARKILEDLAQRDLIADSYSWATLAALRNRAGDAVGRDAAFAKCRASAKRLQSGNICTGDSMR